MTSPTIYVLAGKARSGKDTFCEFIKNEYVGQKVLELKFAFYLRKYVKNINGWTGNDEDKPRSVFQTIGRAMRAYDEDIFVRRMLEDLHVYKDYYDVIIISDARMVKEIESIKKKYINSVSILLTRGVESDLNECEKQDPSETGLDGFSDFDYTISNDGSLEQLKEQAKKIVSEVKNEKIDK